MTTTYSWTIQIIVLLDCVCAFLALREVYINIRQEIQLHEMVKTGIDPATLCSYQLGENSAYS